MSRLRSTRAILCRGWISPTIRCSRAVCSLTPIRRSAVSVVPTSTRSQSTVRPARTITSSVTECIARISIPTRRTTNRIPLTITGRVKLHRGQNVADSSRIRSAWMEQKFVSAARRLVSITLILACSGTARPRLNSSTLSAVSALN